jgi:hypothetical protein
VQDYEENVININKILKADTYINAISRRELYSRIKFEQKGINFKLIEMKKVEYKQFKDRFIPNLSIIDVLMFNSRSELNKLLKEYELK